MSHMDNGNNGVLLLHGWDEAWKVSMTAWDEGWEVLRLGAVHVPLWFSSSVAGHQARRLWIWYLGLALHLDDGTTTHTHSEDGFKAWLAWYSACTVWWSGSAAGAWTKCTAMNPVSKVSNTAWRPRCFTSWSWLSCFAILDDG